MAIKTHYFNHTESKLLHNFDFFKSMQHITRSEVRLNKKLEA